MAERRMFAKTIIDSDAFLDMPKSTQALYFHLSMRADDDGFLNNPKKICRMIGCSDDDLKLLIVKRFILAFESGVIVIKHWRIHNYIQKDRYKPTIYQDEKEQIEIKDNGAYTECIQECIQDVHNLEAQVRLGKDIDRLGKDNINSSPEEKVSKMKHKHGDYNNVLLSDDEYNKLIEELGKDKADAVIKNYSELKEMKGYKYKSDYLAIKKWAITAYEEKVSKGKSGTKPAIKSDSEGKDDYKKYFK